MRQKADRGRRVEGQGFTWEGCKNMEAWTSLVVQWLRIHLPMKGTQVQSLFWGNPTCLRATKSVHCNYWACSLESSSNNYWSCLLQLLKTSCSGAEALQQEKLGLKWLSRKESFCWCRRCKSLEFDPVLARFPEVGNGYPLQYSCLENSMDRGAWWATVHGVTESQTRLSTLHN